MISLDYKTVMQNPISQTEDDDLILRCQKGEMDAFEKLMYKYSNYAASVAYNIIGDPHIAIDMSQEAFIKVHRNIAHLDNPKKFKGWLFSIVRSTCIDWLRKERLKTTSIDKLSDEGIEPTDKDVSHNIEVTSEIAELREKMLNIINGLPKIYQQIILLKHLRDMSYKEMSDLLDVPVATIESRLYRARLLLKEKLQDFYIKF